MRTARRPLTPAWVAGSVRARQLLERRLGAIEAATLARCDALEDALGLLAASAYGRRVRTGMDLATAERAIAATALWHVRVLAGWAPPGALAALRALAGWFELANIEDRLALARGQARVPPPFELGGLASAPAVAGARTVGEIRAALRGSAWHDPGTDEPAEIALVLRLEWARRVIDSVEEARDWVAGAVALFIARSLLIDQRPPEQLLARRAPETGMQAAPAQWGHALGFGESWAHATTLAGLRERLPAQAAWVLADLDDPTALWEAEIGWWRRVETDADAYARTPLLGRRALIGCVALLGVDARRTAAALQVAARGGGGHAMEVFERFA